MQHQMLSANPAQAAKTPRVSRDEPVSLTKAQLKTLITCASDSSIYPIIYVSAYTGLRQSEVLGLRWSDIDLDRMTLSVRQILQTVPRQGLIFKSPKTKRSRRTISISPSLHEIIR